MPLFDGSLETVRSREPRRSYEKAGDANRMKKRTVVRSVHEMASKNQKHGLIRGPLRSHQRARSHSIGNDVAESGYVMRPFGRTRTDERSHQRAPSIYLPYPLVLTLDWINGRPIADPLL